MSPNRQSPFANLTPVVKNLLIINLLCFIPFVFLSEAAYDNLVVKNLGLFYAASPSFRVWQIITYMFLHGGWSHILFNMFALFSFGPILEDAIGPKKFLTLYFICGIGAAAIQIIAQGIELHSLTGSFTFYSDIQGLSQEAMAKVGALYAGPTIGASGAIFGVLVAFAMLYPDLELMLLFVPVPIKAKYLIPIYIIIELVSGIGQFSGDNVAHFAHLGGALLGFIMIKIWRFR